MTGSHVKTQAWYDKLYAKHGMKAQRSYPNEELLRFFGRNFFPLPRARRRQMKILEVGCGSCANLWMIAREGFKAYGLDFSPVSLKVGREMLARWNVSAELVVGSMTDIPFPANTFDAVCDVVASYCLNMTDFQAFLDSSFRVLKPGGKLFLYTPSVKSHAFKNFHPARKIDRYTLTGIHRRNTAYFGNFYPFRFAERGWVDSQLKKYGFVTKHSESISRTYSNGSELFEFLSIEAERSESLHHARR